MPHPIHGRTLAQMNRPGWSAYGLPREDSSGGHHNGFDYYAPRGTPIYGTGEGGAVTAVYFDGENLGWVTETTYPGYVTQDCHQDHPPEGVYVGMPVDTSTIVGYVGDSGNASGVRWVVDGVTLIHDHHVVWVGNKRVDPIAFYGTAPAGGTSEIIIEEEEDMNTVRWGYVNNPPAAGSGLPRDTSAKGIIVNGKATIFANAGQRSECEILYGKPGSPVSGYKEIPALNAGTMGALQSWFNTNNKFTPQEV